MQVCEALGVLQGLPPRHLVMAAPPQHGGDGAWHFSKKGRNSPLSKELSQTCLRVCMQDRSKFCALVIPNIVMWIEVITN